MAGTCSGGTSGLSSLLRASAKYSSMEKRSDIVFTFYSLFCWNRGRLSRGQCVKIGFRIIGIEQLRQFAASAHQPDFHRGKGSALDIAYLIDRQVVDLEQDERFAVFVGQFGKSAVQQVDIG